MSYLAYVAGFGAAAVAFLWLRDARIFARTTLTGYRTAAYRGIFYTALALLGLFSAIFGDEVIGLILILAALYLQGRETRERVWNGESVLDRFLGRPSRRKDKGPR